MKLKNSGIIAGAAFAVIISLFAVSCKDSTEDQSHNSDSLEGPGTKITTVSGMEAIFDLQTMADHKIMMQLMKVNMPHDSTSDHVVLLTLVDEGGDLIKNAEVKYTVTTPSGKTIEKNASIMSGDEVVHYTADFNLSAKGDYTVTATVKHPELSGQGTVKFTLPLP